MRIDSARSLRLSKALRKPTGVRVVALSSRVVLGIFSVHAGGESVRRFRFAAVAILIVASAAGVCVAAQAAGGAPTPSIFAPVSTPAAAIGDYAWLVIAVCGAIFVLVSTLLAYALLRFRLRGVDDGREPPQIYGSNALELAWTLIPVVVVFLLSLVSIRVVGELQIDTRPPGWMPVQVIGHQWWWEIRYPELGITTANELHVPVSDSAAPRPTFLDLESRDVIHSFWIPQLAGKMDVVPNRLNHVWLEPSEIGVHVGQCAEFCGTQHANMLLRVVVHSPEDFRAWARAQRRDAVREAAVAQGRELFLRTACVSCHTVRGTPAAGRFGPDLTHLMSRATLGAGALLNNPQNLRAWIRSPEHFKPGVRMPEMGLPQPEINLVASYLATLK